MIQQQDPSLLPDFQLIYQTQKLFKISSQTSADLKDNLMIRLFINQSSYKMQLTSQSNISMLFCITIGQTQFMDIAKKNQLSCQFQEFSSWLINIFEASTINIQNKKQSRYYNPNHDHNHQLTNSKKNHKQQQLYLNLKILSPKQSLLNIFRQQEFKVYDILNMFLYAVEEDKLKQNVMFRYQKMNLRLNLLNDYWSNIQNLIKTKNPSLLLQITNQNKKKFPFK